MNLHIDYGFHPIAHARLLSRFKKPLRKQSYRSLVYVYARSGIGLKRFLRSCFRKLRVSNAYVFFDAERLSPTTVRRLGRLSKRRDVELIVDAKGKALPAKLVAALLEENYPIVINHCPQDIPGLKVHHDESEEWVSILTAIACYSGLSYKCQFTSCLGSTLFINEKGECRNCRHDERPFALLKDKDVFSKLRDNETLNAVLKAEVPFRKECLGSCPHFALCKGFCPKEQDRCLIKSYQTRVDEAVASVSLGADDAFDRENAISRMAFRK